MNHVGTFTCETCDGDIDCRIGFSNRAVQPLSFSCPHCNALIEVTVILGGSPPIQMNGVVHSKDRQYGMLDGRNPFVDLHLDFPTWSKEYVMGHTPFIMALQKMRRVKDEGARASDYQNFQVRLDQLNKYYEKSRDLKRIIKLYHGDNKKLFIKKSEDFLEEKMERTLASQDINLVLYRLISATFLPFIDPISNADFSETITRLVIAIAEKNKQNFDKFMESIIKTKFLENLQRDCLEIYPRILVAEIALRPALFMDFVEEEPSSLIAGRISTKDFNDYKDLYKDITEIIGKQLCIVAAINNIIHRKDYEKFKPKDGGALSSLEKFAQKTLSEKFKYLDECWFKFEASAINLEARNAIAHYATEYDEKTQIIQYFGQKGGLQQEHPQEMYFLEFMVMLLKAFREMHYLHHVIKCLFYYEYLIRK